MKGHFYGDSMCRASTTDGTKYTSIASRKHHEDHALCFNPCATQWVGSYAAHKEEEKP